MGRKVLELAEMAALPWPTDAQRAAFVDHVCWAHSWYKHLPFEPRATFVVFLADDAGAGFETIERLHYAWKTTAEYRERFGLLDYAWRLPGGTAWQRDAAVDVEPSAELCEAAAFTLAPTCSSDFNAIEVICGRVAREPASVSDPAMRAAIATLDELAQRADAAYRALSDEEQQAIATEDNGAAQAAHLASARVRSYRDHEQRMYAHYEAMRAPEVRAIEAAIARLGEALARRRPPRGP